MVLVWRWNGVRVVLKWCWSGVEHTAICFVYKCLRGFNGVMALKAVFLGVLRTRCLLSYVYSAPSIRMRSLLS